MGNHCTIRRKKSSREINSLTRKKRVEDQQKSEASMPSDHSDATARRSVTFSKIVSPITGYRWVDMAESYWMMCFRYLFVLNVVSLQSYSNTVTSIDSGKVLDAEAIGKLWKQYRIHPHLHKESNEYFQCKPDHVNCKVNFEGSAPAMEAVEHRRFSTVQLEQIR